MWDTVGWVSLKITNTASTSKSVFILSVCTSCWYVPDLPLLLVVEALKGCNHRSASSQHKPQESWLKNSVSMRASRAVWLHDETELQWQSMVSHAQKGPLCSWWDVPTNRMKRLKSYSSLLLAVGRVAYFLSRSSVIFSSSCDMTTLHTTSCHSLLFSVWCTASSRSLMHCSYDYHIKEWYWSVGKM